MKNLMLGLVLLLSCVTAAPEEKLEELETSPGSWDSMPGIIPPLSYTFDGAPDTGVYWTADGEATCVQAGSKIDCAALWELVRWTRHYESAMGLEEHEIQIGTHPTKKWCSWIDPWPGLGATGLFVSKTVIHYDLLRGCQRASARDRAKHETLHLRWKHHHIREMSYEEMEAEVAEHWEDYP